jgi:hypothetical protein
MKSTEDILNLYKTRYAYYQPLHAKMSAIQAIYNGTAEVPLPDMERMEISSVPNLLAQGVDQMSGRITSVTPQIHFASMRPGIRSADRRATDASRTIQAWWQTERLSMKMKQRGRHLLAYAMSPVVVRWDEEHKMPMRHVRHPLEAYPATDMITGSVQPSDCLFAFKRSAGWMRYNGYENQLAALTGRFDTPTDTQILLVEWMDDSETVLLAANYQRQDPFQPMDTMTPNTTLKGIVLERYDNLADECPAIVPMRITLDGAMGQFDTMVGMFYMQARLMALESIAVEKGIFPDTYLVSRQGEVGRFLDGPHDGRTGMVNIIAGGDIKEIQSTPGYLSNQTIDRLERNQRVTSGIPPEFGGESGSNIRTGRRGDAILSAVIDYPVAEAQELFAYSLQEENEVGIQLAKKYDGSAKRTLYVGTGNAARPVTYVADETFESEEHTVSYPASGSDLNSLIIGLGQRVGLGIMSKDTAAQLDPYIDNPEQEHDQIISEGLEQALVAGIQQQASSGQIPPLTLAKIMQLVKNDKLELAEAMSKVAEDAAAEQAAQQQDMGATATPDQMGAGPTVQALAGGQAPVGGPNQGQQNLADLLSTLRKPALAMRG